MTVKVTACCFVLSLSVLQPPAIAADEPARLAQLRQMILSSPLADEPASQLLDRLIDAEGPELYQTSLAVALRRSETAPRIDEILRTGSPSAKRKMTKLIRATGIASAAPQLLRIIRSESEHPLSRTGALYALGAIGCKPAAPAMLTILGNPSRGPTEKRVAIAMLAQLRYKPAVPAIRGFTDDPDELMRIFALRALAELGDKPDIAPLLTSVQSPDFVVRQAACGALGSFGGDAAVGVLTQLADNDFSQLVREQAELSLIRIRAAAMDQAQCNQFLYSLIDHPAAAVRRWAIRSLANERGAPGRQLLRAALRQDHRENDRIAADLLILADAGADFRGGF